MKNFVVIMTLVMALICAPVHTEAKEVFYYEKESCREGMIERFEEEEIEVVSLEEVDEDLWRFLVHRNSTYVEGDYRIDDDGENLVWALVWLEIDGRSVIIGSYTETLGWSWCGEV